MTTNTPLLLTGDGYLEEITFSNDGYCARLKLLPCFNAQGCAKEEIIVECLVNEWHLQSKLDALEQRKKCGHAIIVKFIARYYETRCTHSMMTAENPQIVLIQARLDYLMAAYVDGVMQ